MVYQVNPKIKPNICLHKSPIKQTFLSIQFFAVYITSSIRAYRICCSLCPPSATQAYSASYFPDIYILQGSVATCLGVVESLVITLLQIGWNVYQ